MLCLDILSLICCRLKCAALVFRLVSLSLMCLSCLGEKVVAFTYGILTELYASCNLVLYKLILRNSLVTMRVTHLCAVVC